MLTVLAALEPALNVIKTVLGIGGLIFVHELGHFLVGRWCGVRAEVFSIGFGPALFKWQPGPTEYRIAPIPLGGYVKFLGESPEEGGELEPDSFLAATYPRKAAIMLAGVTMNVITAFVLFVWTFSVGVELPAPVVGEVQPGSPAWEYGIQPGDEIVSIDGKRILEFGDVIQDVVLADAVDVELRRGGELLPVIRIPTREQAGGIRRLGINGSTLETPDVRVVPESAAAEAGIEDGDRIVAFDGKTYDSPELAITAWFDAGGGTLTVARGDTTKDITFQPRTELTHRIGVGFDHLRIGAVQRGGPAALAGVRAGDRPRSVDGDAVGTVGELVERLNDTERPAHTVTFERDGTPVDVPVGPDPAAFAASLAGGGDGVVVVPLFQGEGAGPAAAAGVTAGSTILEADGQAVATVADLQSAVAAAAEAERPVDIRWRTPDGAEHDAAIRPAAVASPTDPGLRTRVELTRVVQETDVLAAVSLGIERTDRWVKRILGTLGSLVTGRVSATNLSGPVAIARITYKTAETGIGQFLLFLGFISMNLAVLNLLPIPMLDGGQLAMITAEKVRGRPLPESVQAGLQWAGLIMLLALMVFVVANDIRNL